MQLVRTLYLHKEKQIERGKKLHACDDRFLKTAEKMINDEFAMVLHIDPDQVPDFISKRAETAEPVRAGRGLRRGFLAR